eukprot:PLAT12526.44.p1 GENE.PLAT12526.44~~PLAT12526.44.p1  ORF type:complete len:385 (+),score=120.10 PLAT12526.44:82-1236(+)
MGGIIPRPKTKKATERAACDGLLVAVTGMQGWRPSMEDEHLIALPVLVDPFVAMFAVFDGHGGTLAAKFCKTHLLKQVLRQAEFSRDKTPHNLAVALSKAFLDTDAALRKQPRMIHGDESGTTAVSVLLTDDYMIVANAGDSRCVLCTGGRVIALSEDHKPYLEKESVRISEAGGYIHNCRVNGDLAVSRALGDFSFKMRFDLEPGQQLVSAEPDISEMPRHAADEFLLLACDGIWDVLSSEAACEFVRDAICSSEDKDVGVIAEALVDHALELGSKDNMTAEIVCFPAAPWGSALSSALPSSVDAAAPAAAAAAAGDDDDGEGEEEKKKEDRIEQVIPAISGKQRGRRLSKAHARILGTLVKSTQMFRKPLSMHGRHRRGSTL